MYKNLMLLFFLVLGICGLSNAQDNAQNSKLTVKASQTEVLLGNYIEVTFAFEGNQRGRFTAPDWEKAGFALKGGPSQSSNFSMINGVTKSTISYTYYIEPLELGTVFIPSAQFLFEKEEISSKPLELHVLKNPEGIIETPGSKEDEFDFWGRPIPKSEPKVAPKKKRATTRI
jgi:BatD DUF11 like domain